ncbi:glucose repression mediator protein [Dimargaris verticillata]|uniref:Glucose repression mediator protein n=1 Tax=Dimargaris verticillata TaxID=2761393 RepID=A0A9W8BBR1_9FUNG|nr:glucose repression mediator protein [Dimargaris verticillata]
MATSAMSHQAPSGGNGSAPKTDQHQPPNGVAPPAPKPLPPLSKEAELKEQIWIKIGAIAESMDQFDRAIKAYDAALNHNPYSIPALTQIAALYRSQDEFSKASDYFQRVLSVDPNNGEIWGAIGHCFLMMDSLTRAYSAYQQALYHLPNAKEPKLWYGIGILYDRFGSYDHAEEAFSAVMKIDPSFEKANEIYFRLGIIYKSQGKYDKSLSCYQYVLNNPPKPLTEADVYFQIGHVHELSKDYARARDAYERVLTESPGHAKVLQQLGWLYAQPNTGFTNPEHAISLMTKSIESDGTDAQSWYLLGRCYMNEKKHNPAYEAYQQAVYRDGNNAHFWCSIGVLYFQITQYRDALDAYSRALRFNPQLSEVWHNLGTLYETCNNQIEDAINAYSRALEIDPSDEVVKQRMQLLHHAQASGGNAHMTPVPNPQDPAVFHSQVPPPNCQEAQGNLQWAIHRRQSMGVVPCPVVCHPMVNQVVHRRLDLQVVLSPRITLQPRAVTTATMACRVITLLRRLVLDAMGAPTGHHRQCPPMGSTREPHWVLRRVRAKWPQCGTSQGILMSVLASLLPPIWGHQCTNRATVIPEPWVVAHTALLAPHLPRQGTVQRIPITRLCLLEALDHRRITTLFRNRHQVTCSHHPTEALVGVDHCVRQLLRAFHRICTIAEAIFHLHRVVTRLLLPRAVLLGWGLVWDHRIPRPLSHRRLEVIQPNSRPMAQGCLTLRPILIDAGLTTVGCANRKKAQCTLATLAARTIQVTLTGLSRTMAIRTRILKWSIAW